MWFTNCFNKNSSKNKLIIACKEDDLDSFKKVYDFYIQDNYKVCPLQYSAKYGAIKITKYLVERLKYKIVSIDKYYYPIRYNFNRKKKTPYYIARTHGHHQVADYLKLKNAEFNSGITNRR
jgi:ankyrin repeat protein